ncbi:hypothetical protein ABPG75_008251 [Micractinium tetrahymenae]
MPTAAARLQYMACGLASVDAVGGNSTLFCWGKGSNEGGTRKLAGSTASPKQISSDFWRQFAQCGVLANGTGACLVDGEQVAALPDPPGGGSWSALSATNTEQGAQLGCGVASDGAAYCFGFNQLAAGTPCSPAPLPAPPNATGPLAWAQVEVGEGSFACRRTIDGQILCSTMPGAGQDGCFPALTSANVAWQSIQALPPPPSPPPPPPGAVPSPPPPTTTEPLPAEEASGSSAPIGAIVGGVVGGLAVVAALIVLLAWKRGRLCWSSRQQAVAPHGAPSGRPGQQQASQAAAQAPPAGRLALQLWWQPAAPAPPQRTCLPRAFRPPNQGRRASPSPPASCPRPCCSAQPAACPRRSSQTHSSRLATRRTHSSPRQPPPRRAGRRARWRAPAASLPCGSRPWGMRPRGPGPRSRPSPWHTPAAAAAAAARPSAAAAAPTSCRPGRLGRHCPRCLAPCSRSQSFRSWMCATGWRALKAPPTPCPVACRPGNGPSAGRRQLWPGVPGAVEPCPVRREAAGPRPRGATLRPLRHAVPRCAALCSAVRSSWSCTRCRRSG